MKSPFDPTIVDAASLFDLAEVVEEQVGSKVTIDYPKLRDRIDSMRAERGWRAASLNTILLSIDPHSEGQQRFEAMLRRVRFEPDVIHFRDTFVSLPPGRNPNELYGSATAGRGMKPIKSLASRIAYIAGLMARYEDASSQPQLLVVSHSFELFGPLADLSRRLSKGKVGLGYFASLLDYRWKLAGLFDEEVREKLGVEFFDLDPFSHELLGVELAGRSSVAPNARSGLSRF